MNQWQEEFKNSLKTIEEFNSFFNISLPHIEYNSFIPKAFAQRIKNAGQDSVLWKQFVPNEIENNQLSGHYDPIGDNAHAKEGQLIHRYKNRALFLPTTICPIICRYCFRKNELTNKDELFKADFEKTLSYLKNHPEIEEIIFSGGDPLILSDSKLDYYLNAFFEMGISYIRFHTRTPIIIPSRLDEKFIDLLVKYQNKFKAISLVLHLNHDEEISDEMKVAVSALRQKTNVQLLSQSVLLKEINDSAPVLKKLFESLQSMGVRPYYLHHPDLVRGGMHFYIELEEGRKIFQQLRDLMPGWLIPNYIIDIPEGHGKTSAFNPESISFSGVLIDRFNQEHAYSLRQ